MTWQAFILAYGWRANGHHLAHVLGQSFDDIDRVRRTGAVTKGARREFGELFTLWHGRAPVEEDWPTPRQVNYGGRTYEILAPEIALVARLVGTMGLRELAGVLTERLRRLTGDATAIRTRNAVQLMLNRSGLQTCDVLGGLTTRDAAARVGRVSLINQAIYNGQLKTFRIGKRHVIPREEFERWLATREEPPIGWIRLASLAKPLGIASDAKLPEYASLGYIPDVVKVQGVGTARGTWYIAPERARQILDDARAGRPRPWYGKPLPGNIRAMWSKWQRRRHTRCRQCAAIWQGPAPSTIEAFTAKYSSLTLGQKRHLTVDQTRPRRGSFGWRPRGSVARRMRDAGLTVYEAASALNQPSRWIRGWIRMGLLEQGGVVRDDKGGEAIRITPLGVCMLRAALDDEAARADDRDWIGVHVAAIHVGTSITTVHAWRRLGQVKTKAGSRGILFDRASLEVKARQYWAWAIRRYKRATPPAWLTSMAAA